MSLLSLYGPVSFSRPRQHFVSSEVISKSGKFMCWNDEKKATVFILVTRRGFGKHHKERRIRGSVVPLRMEPFCLRDFIKF